MKNKSKENAVIPIQQIFVTWSNGARGVFSGPAVLTPEEMSELNLKQPKIISIRVTKPFIMKEGNGGKKEEIQAKKNTKGS